ncbi:nuclear pore complex protein Nup98-Nup96 isoform X2 [Nymphalis io]|uniref:nuclear pore complex protein Nup98-Nup96 isoform X2 n=1 Tax=Inachis io TaxID=171585 RepID=UPI002168CEC1|nr:nuclear pore complex protein Nup98-Nup96 isoform X2 [Nymphalis io]
MFQKQTFGATNTGFGSFNAGASTSSPFSGFKPTAGTSAFGAPPAFGANAAPQPATGGGLFGSTTPSSSLFGGNATTSSFGTTSGFGFGPSTSTGAGLFSNTTSGVGGGLFGNNQNNAAFGAKPAGFGFSNTANTNTTGLFGSAPSTSTGLFGQQNTAIGGGGLFGNTSGGFGQQQATGTAHVKYNPMVGTDVVVKSGTSQNVNIKHHCITCMKEYEGKSLEELRLEDYMAGRKGGGGTSGGVFGGFQQTENKPLFGGPSFGQPATTSAPSLFGTGIGSTPAFGQTNTFSFGNAAQPNTNTTGLFGANKPAFGAPSTGTGLFGATTTQAPAFGTNTSTFGFGSNTQNQPTGGLFGAKPATTGFGAPAASTGFGAFGSGGLFGAKPQQTTAPTFGSTAPTFGATPGFGTNTTGSSLFGGSTFGKPPTTQATFAFNTQPTLGTGLGGGLGTAFQTKPTTPAFGSLGGMGTGSMFQTPAQNNTFRTGLDSGLGGGGLFGNSSALGGNTLGLGQLHANNSTLGGGLVGASAAGNVHEQILSLAARPYGDTPLFKDLLPDNSRSSEDALKATNPACVKAALQGAHYRVASPPSRLALAPRPVAHDRKSLFDGLEESDASLEDKLSLKPSRKRLVLRPNTRPEEDVDRQENSRSIEDASRQEVNNQETRENQDPKDDRGSQRAEREMMKQRNIENNNVDSNSERHGSWLDSSQTWSEKGKRRESGESSPRLYPNLDKELPAQVPERRASWLTTKPLRKPLVPNPESAENSVRELGVRPDRTEDKENIDTLSVSEEENVPTRELPPHPAGVKLTRPGYYTIPSLEEITKYMRSDGSCVVPHLTIGRQNYGNVYFDCEIDVAGMDLDALVHFLNKEVIIYPDDEHKPPVGEGLNRRAVITLERVWPRDKTEKRPVTEPDRLLKMDYEGKLRRVCDKHDTKFIEYRPQTGSWVFRVEHFSKYGLTDSDEDDDITPDVLKRQLVNQNLQKSAAPAQKLPVPVSTASSGVGVVGLGGIGGLGSLGGLGGLGGLGPSDEMFAMQQSSLNLMNGASRVFEMDATEDNSEAPSFYQDNNAFGVKSPTTELARLENRRSHHVQLMKASLYADTEMDEEASVSSGDQLVPASRGAEPATRAPSDVTRVSVPAAPAADCMPGTEEVIMRPLIVRPHTIILNYHRKVPPFKHTIAGRLDAACIADMSVCRARHSRIGFGPAGTLSFVTTYDAINDLPKTADLSSLGMYVSGRGEDDWSESVVARLAVGRSHSNATQDILCRQLGSLLECSALTETGGDSCPRLDVPRAPRERRDLLRRLLRDARGAAGGAGAPGGAHYGMSSEYCLQVWKLCDALWGDDLDNDGVPGMDEKSIVNRHKRLLDWLKESVSDITDKELAETMPVEPEDESDAHSARVWALLAGGRLRDACALSRRRGDLALAALLAQRDDPAFKSLVARQLRVWQQCGAESLVAGSRLATLHLLAGQRPERHLQRLDWLRAFAVTARYLCPQIPTLEQVVRTYEGYFSSEPEADLHSLPEDEMGMQFPLPPYHDQYNVTTASGASRRVLDVRYELLRARAFNAPPALGPATCSPDPFDYSLSFPLASWLGVGSACVVGAAEQLEASGNWHLALQVLAYHRDDNARSHLIRQVLSRHAPSQVDTPEMKERFELIKKLKIPEKWVLIAQANRAKYEHKPALEVEYLVGAEQWNAAHRVLLKELLPDAVLADNLQSIKGILEKMNDAAERHEVSGWETGGQALYHYLRVCDEIRGLVRVAGAAGGAVCARLEALRPALGAACRSLRGLAARSPRHAAARAEMGARLVQLALAGGEPPPHLAALLAQLRLPPDCAARAAYRITTDMAERASELCVDSAPSPESSQRTAAVQT